MLFACARQIPAADQSTQAGKWEKSRFMGVEITGKMLGVIGCGNIGSVVASRALGLEMRVIAYDPFLSEERAAELGVEKVELDALFHRADFITLHTPLTDKTQQHHRRGGDREDEGRRQDHQLRARRAGRRGGASRGARQRQGRGRRDRRLRRGAGEGERALRRAERRVHAASRRLDERGAGERRRPDRRADGGLSDDRRGQERAQHAVDQRRGGAAADALRAACRAARLVCRPADGDRRQGGSSSNTRAPSPT